MTTKRYKLGAVSASLLEEAKQLAIKYADPQLIEVAQKHYPLVQNQDS